MCRSILTFVALFNATKVTINATHAKFIATDNLVTNAKFIVTNGEIHQRFVV